MDVLNVSGKITGIKYIPLLTKSLKKYHVKDFSKVLAKESVFILDLGKNNELAISSWVSAKRTRSYPYERVYNTLSFAGKKVAIIPIFKDEGKDGDRDFLQWDTISLMSLLGVHVIISYYKFAEKSLKYGNKKGNKITNQRFDTEQIILEIEKLTTYHSDALHWNLEQIDKAGRIGGKALKAYEDISKKTGVEMHLKSGGESKIKRLLGDKKEFMKYSRFLAEKAQKREGIITQPHENVDGSKCTLTITNYLKGVYFFTCDECKIKKDKIYLTEAKHSSKNNLPSLSDIKDGILKMILFTNLNQVLVKNKEYFVKPILKLTTAKEFDFERFKENNKEYLDLLIKEANKNKFKITINESPLN